ncbi:hypothetical protein QJQ45_016135 [Haematococcus lacustris]|nr:hypothetical protein QJQ45_016135 [Haematococcus lacustris]
MVQTFLFTDTGGAAGSPEQDEMTGRWKAASLLPSFARRAIQDRASQAYVQTDALPACQYLRPFAAQARAKLQATSLPLQCCCVCASCSSNSSSAAVLGTSKSHLRWDKKNTARALHRPGHQLALASHRTVAFAWPVQPSFNKSLFVSKRITGPQVTTTAPWPWLDPNRPYVPPVLLEPKGSQLQLPDAVEAVKANISLRAAELAKNTGRSPDRCLVPRSSETVEVIINTLTDPKLSDHMVRGTVTLPHSIGKVARVAVFAKDAQVARAALEAGADVVGGEELVQAIVESGGDSIDFDTAFTTPDFMKALVKAGKVLGPRGLMPNPKMGTLTLDIAGAVKAVKAGRMEFKVTKERVLHSVLGKATAPSTHLKENCQTLVKALLQHRPASLPGRELEGYIASIYLKSAQTSPVRVAPDSCLP